MVLDCPFTGKYFGLPIFPNYLPWNFTSKPKCSFYQPKQTNKKLCNIIYFICKLQSTRAHLVHACQVIKLKTPKT